MIDRPVGLPWDRTEGESRKALGQSRGIAATMSASGRGRAGDRGLGGTSADCWQGGRRAIDEGWFVKLWRYREGLSYSPREGTHTHQFPDQLLPGPFGVMRAEPRP